MAVHGKTGHPLLGSLAGLAVLSLLSSVAFADSAYDQAFEARYRGAQDRGTLDLFTGEAVRAGQYDQALSTLEQVIFEDPNNIDARVQIARLYYHVGAFDLALGHVSEALTLAGGNADFERAILELKALIEKADRGVRATLDVTVGADVSFQHRAEGPFGFPPAENNTSFGGEARLDGVIEFDLQTASRDIITLSAGGYFDQIPGDFDFSNFDTDSRFDSYGGYGAITLSKGLPDIIDTLRLDTSLHGEIGRVGRGFDLDGNEADLVRTEIGVRNRLSVRPTVETVVYADFDYGYLGASKDMYENHRIDYGAGALYRFAPGWTLGAYAGGFNTWGEVPGTVFDPGTIFEFVVDPEAFELDGWTANADVTHLLHVFADGRSWFHEFGVSYTDEDVLNYSNIFYGFADVVRRQSWQVSYDHIVQTSTHGQLKLGLAYTNQTFDQAFGGEQTDFVTGHIRYTHRFE